MKKFFAIAMAAVAALGISACAQDTTTAAPCGQPNCQKGQPGDNNKMRQPVDFTEYAFEGILLDMNQQQRIDSLNQAVKANRPDCKQGKGQCKEGKGQCKEGKGQCPNGQVCPGKQECPDSACVAPGQGCGMGPQGPQGPQGPRGPQGPKGPQVCPEYVAKVKEILTPEQYTMFLENIVLAPQAQGPQGKPGMRGGEGPRCEKAGKAGCEKAGTDSCGKAGKGTKAGKPQKANKAQKAN